MLLIGAESKRGGVAFQSFCFGAARDGKNQTSVHVLVLLFERIGSNVAGEYTPLVID